MKKLFTLAVLSIASSAYAGPVLDSILSTKTINYGARPNSIPYSKITDRGNFEGYSHDVCNEIKIDIEKKHKVSLTVQKQEVAATTGILFVANNTTQLMCGAASQTPERLKSANFLIVDADPVVPAVLGSNNSIKSVEDLKGKTVGVVKGTTGEVSLSKLNAEKNWGVRLINVKDYPEAFLLLEQGRIEAVVTNGVLLAGNIAKMPANKFKLLPTVQLSEPELIGVVYSKTDNEMVELVKATEKRIKSDGTLERLHAKWFTKEIPSGGNLNMHWTAEQKGIVLGK